MYLIQYNKLYLYCTFLKQRFQSALTDKARAGRRQQSGQIRENERKVNIKLRQVDQYNK